MNISSWDGYAYDVTSVLDHRLSESMMERARKMRFRVCGCTFWPPSHGYLLLDLFLQIISGVVDVAIPSPYYYVVIHDSRLGGSG